MPHYIHMDITEVMGKKNRKTIAQAVCPYDLKCNFKSKGQGRNEGIAKQECKDKMEKHYQDKHSK